MVEYIRGILPSSPSVLLSRGVREGTGSVIPLPNHKIRDEK